MAIVSTKFLARIRRSWDSVEQWKRGGGVLGREGLEYCGARYICVGRTLTEIARSTCDSRIASVG